ncbi:AMP-binding domain-containing protein [Purpureocillium lavendulum]|uniref:AMP-binding domain-containing protein n=1 Tax=Purpureocillium lavendulum TaxID=1247861 RepID=A0AB34G512_9HYPO|nr:AMP-binding domain-containing protein [Purpureocillium lavendulum]
MRYHVQHTNGTAEAIGRCPNGHDETPLVTNGIWTEQPPSSANIETIKNGLVTRVVWGSPMALAIRSADVDLTYLQLDGLSTRLAQQLSSLGVKPETKVVICLENTSSWLAPISVLAAMKTGASLTSLDLTRPRPELLTAIAHIPTPLFLSTPENESLVRQLAAGKSLVIVHPEQRPGDELWQILDPDTDEDFLQELQNQEFAHVPKKGVEAIHVERIEISEHSSDSSESASQDGISSGIQPLSLLSPSINKEEALSHAARLCHVKQDLIEDLLPCTPLQQGLLALSSKRPGDYVAKNEFELGKDVDPVRLYRTWERVVALNPILRTRFVSLPQQGIVQVVLDEGLSWSTVTNPSKAAETEPDAMILGSPLTRFIHYEDPAGGPGRLVWEIHHSLYDGQSLPMLLNQVESIYFDEPFQHLEPMSAFIKYIQSRDPGDDRVFWERHFDNFQGPHFPLPRTGNLAQPDHQMAVTISEVEWGSGDFTAATILRAAWAVAIANGAGSGDAAFGATVTGRQAPIPGIELMAGPTIATVPIRVVVDWDLSFSHLLEKVQRQAADMIPFEQTGLQNISKMSEQAALGCDFQSLLVVQPAVQGGSDIAERCLLSEVSDPSETHWQDFSTYPIVVECQLEADGVMLRIAYDSSMISEEQMKHVVRNFESSISQLSNTAMAQEPVALLADDGLDRIWELNSVVPQARDALIHDLISQRVTENPSAPAICAWDGDFSYQEVEGLSRDLALHLVDMGVVVGMKVALLFEKSGWMAVAALGCIKAGGACIAVDATQPEERLRSIVSQSESPIVISSIQNKSLAIQLGFRVDNIVVVGPDKPWATSNPATKLPTVLPSNSLYVVFTSGSTGTPKGAINTHSGFCTAIEYQQQALGFTKSSRVFDFASYAFDAFWCNLFHALTSGGCLCVPSNEERQNDLARSLEKYNATTVDFTPSVARIVGKRALSKLSTLILGGEAVLDTDASLAGGQTDIINVYGPAECTPTVTLTKVSPGDISIGRGAGACTWIVDPDNPDRLSRFGAIGELWIEGPLVGNGYLNDPDKTAAAFVHDPSWLLAGVPKRLDVDPIPGRTGRLYRTGDLVRYRQDGSLIFVGRKDTQVKIRGQRVELAEVEQHIIAALGLPNATVVAETLRPQGSNSVSLVAFVNIDNNESWTEEDHSKFVRQATESLTNMSLPIYMMPVAYIPIFKLPVMTSGKTDRRQLRQIGESVYQQYRLAADTGDSTETLTEIEAILQQVWMSILNLSAQEASVNKAFTRLGGDSISAMQVVSQCKLHNLVFTVSDILQASTIRKLAGRCRVVSRHNDIAEDVEEDGNDLKPFELSPIQQMFFDAYPEGLDHFNQSFMLELSRLVHGDTLYDATRALVKRHAMLRARFAKDPETGSWTQHIVDDGDSLAFGFAEHFVQTRDQIVEIGQARQESLSLQHGPVFSCDLFQIPDRSQMIILSAHHAVVDLVSWRIIWNDIEDHLSEGKLLAQPTASFRSWTRRQARVSSKASPFSVLPFAIPEPDLDFWGLPLSENTFSNCDAYNETFDVHTTSMLFGDANDCLRTEPIDIIIGVMIHAFVHTFPERAAPVVWIEGHGREQSDELPLDVSSTVGWFTTLHPRPVPISLESSVLDAIRLAKDRRRQTPGKGQPYYACRYHSASGREAFNGQDTTELTLNFTGRYQQLEGDEGLFRRPEYLGHGQRDIAEVSGSARRFTMIEINADIEDNMLACSFAVHKKMKYHGRIIEWLELFGDTLNAVTKDLVHAAQRFTLTDFPLLPLSYEGLDVLQSEQLPGLGIQPQAIVDIYPCSPLQEGILLSAEKESASYSTYSVFQCIPTDGVPSVSTARLEEAWKTVVKRHTILQSVFTLHPEGNGFIQIVLSGSRIKVSQLTTDDDPAAVLSCLERPEFAPGEPEHAFTICRSHRGDVACRLDASHSLIDASSMSIIVQDIISVYDGCEMVPAAPFVDMINYISSIPRAQRIASWTKLLKGVQPCEFPVSTAPASGAESHSDLSIPAEAIEGVSEFCKNLGITRSVFIQVAWSMVLAHFNGTSEACFGYLASGRDSPLDGIWTMVGPLANLLISRVNLALPAKQVIERASQDSIQHLSIQHTSLAEIQHELGLSGKRLFNTALSIREADKFKAGDDRTIEFQPYNGEDPHEYDLSLSANLDSGSMDIVIEFREPYVDKASAAEASRVLVEAIRYLIQTGADVTDLQSDVTLSDGFFKHIVGADMESVKTFWSDQFSGTEGAHFPRQQSMTPQTRQEAEVFVKIEDLVWDGCGVFTLATLAKSAWSVVVARLLDSEEALFGSTVADGGVILPFRVVMDPTTTVDELLHKVQTQTAEMMHFSQVQSYYIRSLNQEAKVACDFQTVLIATEQSDDSGDGCDQTAAMNGVTHGLHGIRLGTSALLIELHTSTSGVEVTLRFDQMVIGKAQIARLAHQFEHVLRQLMAPSLRRRRIRELEVASPQDLRDVWDWNSVVPQSIERPVHDLIAQRARQWPHNPAVAAWDGTLTYGQLHEQSNSLAHALVRRGVGRGSIVPLIFEKSMWMAVAALAVMKTGAAAVATDMATQPEERLRAIVTQVDGRLCLSSQANKELAERLGADDVVVVGQDTCIASVAPINALPAVSPSDTLYVIFTSGSTGKPKGAKITHRNMATALAYQRDTVGYRQSSRVLDFSSYAFDVCWSNLLNTLTAGACLCVPSMEERQNDVSAALKKYDVTLADFTPSIARHTQGLDSLSTLILGGEVVLSTDRTLANATATVSSAYGPAECTPTATILDLSGATEGGLGRGVGLVTWIVNPDDADCLAPIGAVGELWLEGPLVGDGYLNDPEKTAASFIRDPAWLVRGIPGERSGRRGTVYRTGDLVQYNDDGSLRFIGRKDTQVKIRGQRVELEEVEQGVSNALSMSNEGITGAQVVAEVVQPQGGEHKILAAFVTFKGDRNYKSRVKQATAGLNERLAQTLPPYMIPSIYVPLKAIPRVSSGKVDRRQLRAMGDSLTAKEVAALGRTNGERRPPQSDAEKTMQQLWAEILKIDPESISADDSFFRIGGDSIGAMRLVSLARQRGVSLQVRDIFKNPLLRDLAALDP